MIDPEMHLILDDHDGLFPPSSKASSYPLHRKELELDRWVGIMSLT